MTNVLASLRQIIDNDSPEGISMKTAMTMAGPVALSVLTVAICSKIMPARWAAVTKRRVIINDMSICASLIMQAYGALRQKDMEISVLREIIQEQNEQNIAKGQNND